MQEDIGMNSQKSQQVDNGGYHEVNDTTNNFSTTNHPLIMDNSVMDSVISDSSKQVNKSEANYLSLGANKNYKTKVIQDRWEEQRARWLDPQSHANYGTGYDPRDGIPAEELPIDHARKSAIEPSISVRKMIKMTMRSVQTPYEAFEG